MQIECGRKSKEFGSFSQHQCKVIPQKTADNKMDNINKGQIYG
jgi:hypothetical protein